MPGCLLQILDLKIPSSFFLDCHYFLPTPFPYPAKPWRSGVLLPSLFRCASFLLPPPFNEVFELLNQRLEEFKGGEEQRLYFVTQGPQSPRDASKSAHDDDAVCEEDSEQDEDEDEADDEDDREGIADEGHGG